MFCMQLTHYFSLSKIIYCGSFFFIIIINFCRFTKVYVVAMLLYIYDCDCKEFHRKVILGNPSTTMSRQKQVNNRK